MNADAAEGAVLAIPQEVSANEASRASSGFRCQPILHDQKLGILLDDSTASIQIQKVPQLLWVILRQ